VASVAYIDPGNFATNIQGGTEFGYRLLWVLLWSNVIAIFIQFLSAKLGIVTGLSLPQNCRKHFSARSTWLLWGAGEISAIATDLAEFLGAAIGLDLLFGPLLFAYGLSPRIAILLAAVVAAGLVFGILALELAGHLWLERGIIVFVVLIGACYGFEVFLVHPDWHKAYLATLIPSLDTSSAAAFHASIYTAVGMLGATVMPHVIYLHSALMQPRRKQVLDLALGDSDFAMLDDGKSSHVEVIRRFLRLEFLDVFIAMNGAWLINSAMILMAAVAFGHSALVQPTMEQAYHTLGPLFGQAAALVFAIALLCSGLSSSTVGVMAGQVIIEGFLAIKFPIYLRRLITIVPALIVLGIGLDPLRLLVLSQVILSFTLPFALIPLLILTSRAGVMEEFVSPFWLRVTGWVIVGFILALNGVLIGQLAFP